MTVPTTGYWIPVSADPVLLAAEAELNYADLDRPGIARRRRGKGFSYHGPRGGTVDPATRQRIEALVIPPAWGDVWIAVLPNSHIQAVGNDDAGRRQYLYHPRFREVADEVKFARVGLLGERIIDVRRAVRDAIDTGDERQRLIAVVVRLIDLTLMRVGTERYADENQSFGATTLRCEHVTVAGDSLSLCFVGKGGQEHFVDVDDPDLISYVAGHREDGESDLLFATSDGATVDGTAVGNWLSEAARLDVTAKDLRTLGASATMIRALIEPRREDRDRDRVVAAFDVVADRLGDTRTVARTSYVAPQVVDAQKNGSLDAIWRASRSSTWRSREESVLTKLLAT